MIKTMLLVISAFTLCSCGTLGIYKDNISHDPEFNAKVIREISENPIGKKMDSLIERINAAKSVFPNDLSAYSLVIETFRYEEFLAVQQTKFHVTMDSPKRQKYFKKYEAAVKKRKLVQNPKFDIVYMNKDQYASLDVERYPYILKTTLRLSYELEKLVVTIDGGVYPWSSSVEYYILDRRTREVFRAIENLDDLSLSKR